MLRQGILQSIGTAAVVGLVTAPVLAGGGDKIHPSPAERLSSAHASQPPSQSTPSYAAPRLSISMTVSAPPAPGAPGFYVTLRSPEGSLRRFEVEGGQAAIHTHQVIVRAGQSVTVRWAPR
jgi:hypothetical protein